MRRRTSIRTLAAGRLAAPTPMRRAQVADPLIGVICIDPAGTV